MQTKAPKACPFCVVGVIEPAPLDVWIEEGPYIESTDSYAEEGNGAAYLCRNCGQGFVAWTVTTQPED